MNHGLTQVILMKLALKNRMLSKGQLPVKIRFSYYDIDQGREVVQESATFVTLQQGKSGDLVKESEVRKNFTIACLAQSLRDMATAWDAGHYNDAEEIANNAISEAYGRYPSMDDK